MTSDHPIRQKPRTLSDGWRRNNPCVCPFSAHGQESWYPEGSSQTPCHSNGSPFQDEGREEKAKEAGFLVISLSH